MIEVLRLAVVLDSVPNLTTNSDDGFCDLNPERSWFVPMEYSVKPQSGRKSGVLTRCNGVSEESL